MKILKELLDYIKRKDWEISITKNSFSIIYGNEDVRVYFKDNENIDDIIKEAIKEMEEKTTFLGNSLVFLM